MAKQTLPQTTSHRPAVPGNQRSEVSRSERTKRRAIFKIAPEVGRHVIWHNDSTKVRFEGGFDLVLCSPPYFHPRNHSTTHGLSPRLADMDEFAQWVARVLLTTSRALKARRPLCFVKTDVKYRRTVLPVGFRIAESMEKLGFSVLAHWVWLRLPHYSPYAPSFANIFVFGQGNPESLRHRGLFRTDDCRNRTTPSSFTPVLFEQLIRQFTKPNSCVLDPFVGLGSTPLAASRSGRWSVGVELSAAQVAKAKEILSDQMVVTVRTLR